MPYMRAQVPPRRSRRLRAIVEAIEPRVLLSTYTVTNLNDSGAGSLRDAVRQGNAHAGPDTIDFAGGLTGTITLTSGPLELTDTTGQTSLVGPAANLLSVSGNNAGRVLQVDAGVSASVAGLTIQGGTAATATGGGILNNGTLAIDACEVRSNTAGGGGGVYTAGALTVTASTFSDNAATSSTGGGGAIEVAGGTVTLLNSTFSRNTSSSGGGAIQTTATLTINDCTIDGNTAQTGGGIAIKGGNTSAFNTIVAENATTSRFPSDVFGNFDAHLASGAPHSAYNLIGTGGAGGLADGVNGNLVGRSSIGAGPFGPHGGPTDTMPLNPLSPALDAGSNALLPATVQTDQRGYVRIINNRLDIGAYEYEAAPAGTPLLVNTTADGDYVPGQLTFLQALYLSNAVPGPHTITFDPSVFGGGSPVTIITGTRPLEITNTGGTIAVQGPGPGNFVWSGNNQNAMFQLDRQTAVTLSGMTLSGGTSPSTGGNGGAVSNAGSLTLVDDVLTANSASASGGAVYSTGSLLVNRCTFSVNTSAQGGGISNIGGTLLITNSTFSGNTAASGAAVFNTGSMTITNGTLAANVAGQGAQVTDSGAGRGTLNNTIVTGGAGGTGADLAGTFGGAYNLITDGTGALSASQHNLLGSAANPIDAKLAPLANYGGPTPTMPPLPGSPALAAGSPALAVDGSSPPAPLSTDQRGFPRVLNSRIDIGSVQTQPNLVNTVNDTALGLGEWSLRSAVDLANANPVPVVIGFDPSIFAPGTHRVITLFSPLDLRRDATIDGPGAAIATITAPTDHALVVEAASSVQVNGLAFSNCTFDGAISNAGSLSISSCVISNNRGYVSGAVVNTGNLTVQDTTFAANHTPNTGGQGGAILSSGTLEVTRCTFSGNSAGYGGGAIASTAGSLVVTSSTFNGDSNTYDAGGILNAGILTLTDSTFSNELGGPLTTTGPGMVARCTFTNNPGFTAGGIVNGGNLSVTDCTFSGNSGYYSHAGGIDNSGPGTLTVRDCLFTGNTSQYAGAIYNQDTTSLPTSGGTVNVIDCTFTANAGGLQGAAIFNAGTLNVSGSTFFKNSGSFQGGALANLGTANITDSTFTQNSAIYGGAIDNITNGGFDTAHLNLYNCTIVGNSATQGGGGIDQMVDSGPGVIMLWNTIVAGNLLMTQGGTTPSDIRGVCGGWYNLIGDGSGGLSARDHNLRGTPSALIDSKLAALGDYGGPTMTMPPLSSSPTVDAGGNSFVPHGVIADQRGDYRIFNGAAEIGAVEYGSVSLLPGDADGNGTVAFADLLVLAQDYGITNATFPHGDFNDDGSVGFDDLLLLAQNYGKSAALGSIAAPVADAPATRTYTVTNLNDDGPGSLRDIIRQVNASPTEATVVFSVTGTITLSSQLELSNDVTIQGPGTDLLQINGNAQGRVFFVDSGVTASISGVTVSGGVPQWGDYPTGTVSGGGIFNAGTLTLANDVVSGNTAGMAKAYADAGVYDRAGNGGGVYNLGDLTVVDSTISGNVAGHGYNSPTSYEPTVGPGGSGGGVFAAGPITLTDSTLSGNTTGDGGMLPQGYGLNGAAEAGSGGGLYAAVPVSLFNCTISGNSIGAGGLDYGYPDGSGIHSDAGIQLTNVTISANVGNGLFCGNAQPLLYNTIVAGNTGADFFGTLDPAGSHNLVGGNPLLAPLGWYGGPTQTMPPLPDSPALDAGSNTLAVDGGGNPLGTDQRGLPRIANGTVDIGASETQPTGMAQNMGSAPQAILAAQPLFNDLTSDGSFTLADFLEPAQNHGAIRAGRRGVATFK